MASPIGQGFPKAEGKEWGDGSRSERGELERQGKVVEGEEGTNASSASMRACMPACIDACMRA